MSLHFSCFSKFSHFLDKTAHICNFSWIFNLNIINTTAVLLATSLYLHTNAQTDSLFSTFAWKSSCSGRGKYVAIVYYALQDAILTVIKLQKDKLKSLLIYVNFSAPSCGHAYWHSDAHNFSAHHISKSSSVWWAIILAGKEHSYICFCSAWGITSSKVELVRTLGNTWWKGQSLDQVLL